MKIAICGPARSGKDLTAQWFVDHCGLRYAGSTSVVIRPYAAKHFGISEEEADARKHQDRETWRVIGDELRKNDKAFLAREVLSRGDLCVGVRSLGEIDAVIGERMVDALLWIDRAVAPDPTLEYTAFDIPCIVVPNRGFISDLHERLCWLARSWGLL